MKRTKIIIFGDIYFKVTAPRYQEDYELASIQMAAMDKLWRKEANFWIAVGSAVSIAFASLLYKKYIIQN